jgi:hypothetical protein
MMTKTDKKIENMIREALTEVCELALENVNGFKWLTHLVANYKIVSDSIAIICVFETNDDLSKAIETHQNEFLYQKIKEKLSAVSIEVKNIQQQVRFDSEEACEQYHGGKWVERLK